MNFSFGQKGKGVAHQTEVIDEDYDDSFDGHVDRLTEKRSTTREKSYQQVNNQLANGYNPDLLSDRIETIIEAIVKTFKREAEAEHALAARTLSICALMLGGPQDSDSDSGCEILIEKCEDTLVHLVSEGSDCPEASRCEFISCLGILYFMHFCAEGSTHLGLHFTDYKDALSLMTSLMTESTSAAVRAEATSAFTLMISTLPHLVSTRNRNNLVDLMENDILSIILPAVVAMLEDISGDVRLAAGEALAMIIYILKEMVETREENAYFDYETELIQYIDPHGLEDSLEELQSNKNKFQAKKERLRQKDFFKDVISFLREGDMPCETIKLVSKTATLQVEFSAWPGVVQLGMLRDILGPGALQYLTDNPSLEDMFDLTIAADEFNRADLRPAEKRMYQSDNSFVNKARTKERARGRDSRRAVLDAEH
eukprot:TRINITY_DN3030_c0_g1_i1.p1 TRINITY_DN3030_c0_g1~~TRINITY_DN3030_c0_g1_i1.p1  ORF type:complete len:427 (-),score=103.31 TRINITY_DN3030_c0_g1_i1:169-1449(-)